MDDRRSFNRDNKVALSSFKTADFDGVDIDSINYHNIFKSLCSVFATNSVKGDDMTSAGSVEDTL
jgi:hypothetical protein